MSTFDGSFSEVDGSRFDVPKLSEQFISRYPEMSAAFMGMMDKDGVKFVRHPASITVWFERDLFKFCVSPRYSGKIAFGSGSDGVGGFSEIEQALKLKHFEWKLRGGQKRS